MRVLLGILMVLSWTSLVSAQSKDAKVCASIEDSLRRLNCYDSYLRSGTTSNQQRDPGTVMTLVDFMTDFDDLVGKPVKVQGFGLIIGDTFILYQEMGSLNGAFVSIERIARNNMRELLTRCGSGCNAVVTGVARKVMFQRGIVAQSVSVGQ